MRSMLVVVALIVSSNVAHAGWYLESSTTNQGEGQEPSSMFAHKARTWIDGERIRTEFNESKSPLMPSGSYMISTNGGQSMLIIDPAQKTVIDMNPKEMADMAMGMMGGMMKFTQPQFEVLANEDAGKLLDQSVRRYKFRTAYNTEMNMFGMKNITQNESIQEFVVAPGIKNPSGSMMQGHPGIKTGDAAFDKRVADEMAKVAGLPLSMVLKSRTTANGTTQETVMNMTVTRLEAQAVAASKFAIPDGYTSKSVFEAAAGIPREESKPSGQPPAFDPKAMEQMLKNFKLPARN